MPSRTSALTPRTLRTWVSIRCACMGCGAVIICHSSRRLRLVDTEDVISAISCANSISHARHLASRMDAAYQRERCHPAGDRIPDLWQSWERSRPRTVDMGTWCTPAPTARIHDFHPLEPGALARFVAIPLAANQGRPSVSVSAKAERAVRRDALALLELLELGHLADAAAGGQPFGTLKRLEAGTRPYGSRALTL
jgi:hypothetical protein